MQLPALYRPILRRALSIVWRHKFLWFFGFFAALLGGSGEIDILFGGSANINWGQNFTSVFGQIFKNKEAGEFFSDLGIRLAQVPATGILIFVLFILGLVVLIWLFIISQIALIDSTARLGSGGETGSKIRQQAGKKYFWKIFGVNVINKLVIYGLLFLMSLPFLLKLYEGKSGGIEILLAIISFIVLVPLAIIFSFVMRYASCFVILNQEKVFEAIRKGVGLFFRNWLISIEMAILFFGLNILIGLGMTGVVLVASMPFMAAGEFFINTGSAFGSWITMVLSLVVILGILAVFGAFFVAFTYSGWTLLFLELTSGSKKHSRLVRWVAGVVNK
ncbi:hypothetical protein HQ544_05490 [Candidatus Falkowbacteria bacterium]|nr:hypothetical protein [Candidatus Falkowbacteria bacterium]